MTSMDGSDFYRQRAVRRLAIAAVVIAAVAVEGWYLARSDTFQKIAALESSAEHIAAQKLDDNFSAPAPLVATSTQNGGQSATNRYTLTREGDIADTNVARAANGNLPPLAENTTLDDIAQIRLDDMFTKQYFAHVSPASSSAITVAKAVGYDYISLGENLALGNFDGDQGVVTAWMNSPGHRANILGAQYTEIGVAVGKGIFQGDEVWIAVQVFGRPLSDCPSPDASLKAQLDTEEAQVGSSSAQLAAEKAQIDAMQPHSGDAYDQAVAAYNTQAAQYNALVAQTKLDVVQYNQEVGVYNACIGSGESVTTSTLVADGSD